MPGGLAVQKLISQCLALLITMHVAPSQLNHAKGASAVRFRQGGLYLVCNLLAFIVEVYPSLSTPEFMQKAVGFRHNKLSYDGPMADNLTPSWETFATHLPTA